MDYEGTIDKISEAFKTQIEQAKGEKEQTPFLDTFGEYADLKALLDDMFNTDGPNDEWVSIKGDENRSELKDGVRLRLIVSFLAMWKKSLLKACSNKTDVDKVFDGDIACINTGLQSLEATKRVLAEAESDAKQ